SRFISLPLPCCDLFSELFLVVDATAWALALLEADLVFAHVGPTGVFRSIETAQDATGLGRRKCLIQRAGGMDRQIVLHDTDAGSVGIMDVDEFAHAVRVVYGGAAVCNLDVAPATMRVEGNEEIDGAVAAVLVIVALALPRLSRNRLTHLADELDGGLVEADQ